MDKKFCTIPGKEQYWVKIIDCVSIKQWNRWRSADYEETQLVIPELIESWNLVDAKGNPVEVKDFLDIDVQFLNWLVTTITDVIIDRMRIPEKNSSSSQSAPTTKA